MNLENNFKKEKIMKVIKYIFLEILLLISMLFISTFIMNLFDLIFNLQYEDIWNIGFKVGFIAWLGLLVFKIVVKKMKK